MRWGKLGNFSCLCKKMAGSAWLPLVLPCKPTTPQCKTVISQIQLALRKIKFSIILTIADLAIFYLLDFFGFGLFARVSYRIIVTS